MSAFQLSAFCNVIVVSADDDIMPFSDFLFERSGLGAIVSQGIVPKRQMHWRFGRGGQPDDGCGEFRGITWLTVIHLSREVAHLAGRCSVVGNNVPGAGE